MTAIQMNAELFRELSIIAEDETLSAKLMKYIKIEEEISVNVISTYGHYDDK